MAQSDLTRVVEPACKKLAEQQQVELVDVELAREGAKFELAFLDPPYRMENTGEMCAALYDRGLLAGEFLLVVEHRRGLAPLVDTRFEAFDQRDYGDTQITFIRGARRTDSVQGPEGGMEA